MITLIPHVTERASTLALNENHPVYTFRVSKAANKGEVIRAVKAAYKVTPRKVAMLTVRPKKVMMRGRLGHTPGFKKAMVYLKKGDKIDLA